MLLMRLEDFLEVLLAMRRDLPLRAGLKLMLLILCFVLSVFFSAMILA
jgi:hypothetical protein